MQFIGKETDPEEELHNLFRLDKLDVGSPFHDRTFVELDEHTKSAVLRYKLCVRFIFTDNEQAVRDVFKRLNRYLTPLKPQELRNATFTGPFIKLAERLANDSFWAEKKIVSPALIRRMTDIEMMSDLLIGLLHGPQDGASKSLDKYYEQYEHFDDEFPEQPRIEEEFDETKRFIAELFPDLTEHRWRNRADYYSLFVALGELRRTNQEVQSENLRSKLIDFGKQVSKHVKDEEAKVIKAAEQYARAVVKGPSSKARRTERHEALLSVVRGFFKVK